MEDGEIVDLYWKRSENAITETSKKYSRYCHYISFNVLHNDEDAEECVNDTYIRAWNSMPTQRPNRLSTFLGKITRNLSINKYKGYTAEKRGAGQSGIILSELDECVPSSESVDQKIDEMTLADAIKPLSCFVVTEEPNCVHASILVSKPNKRYCRGIRDNRKQSEIDSVQDTQRIKAVS